jgi:hypothetical protein
MDIRGLNDARATLPKRFTPVIEFIYRDTRYRRHSGECSHQLSRAESCSIAQGIWVIEDEPPYEAARAIGWPW